MKQIFVIVLCLVISGISYGQEESATRIVNCAAAAKVDEFIYTSLDEAKERLEIYGLQIKNENALGIVIGYGGKRTQSNEGRNIANEVEEYLTARFKFSQYFTLSPRDGGHREEKTIELFIKYDTCGSDPEVSPSLGSDDVIYKEEKDFFDKFVVRKSSTELKSLQFEEIEPLYPAAARAVRAAGKVVVLVQVDEKGHAIKSTAVDGHPLLRAAAENAIKQTSFRILRTENGPVKYGGKIEIDFSAVIDKITIDN